jgi:putative ABC transport system ATP-binding protein
VAGAVAGEPVILLADEPTGNLDSKSGESVMELLRELYMNGATICMVTHDPRYARHAQRNIYLFDGRVVDTPEEVTSENLEVRTTHLRASHPEPRTPNPGV